LDTHLFDQFAEAVTVMRPDGTCVYLNPAAERAYGRPREAMVGQDLWALYPAAAMAPIHAAFARVAETGRAEQLDVHSATLDRAFSFHLYRSEGRVYLFARDVTAERRTLQERQRLQEALGAEQARTETERARLEALFAQAPACIALLRGPEHLYVLSNPVNDRFLGRSDVVGRTVGEVVPEFAEQGIVALLDRVYASGEAYSHREQRFEVREPGGPPREHFVDLLYQPTRDARGHVDGVAIFGFDVTAQVRARQQLEGLTAELRQGEQRYRSLVAATSAVVWTTDGAGAFVTPQPSWEAYTGHGWERHRGWGWAEALHPEDRARMQEEWQAALRAPRRFEARTRLWHAGSQAWRHSLVRAVPLHQPDGTPREWVGMVTDVEDEWRQEQGTRFLAAAGATLNRTLGLEETLTRVASLAVPALADWCGIHLQESADAPVQLLTIAHQDPARAARALDLARHFPQDRSVAESASEVMKSGRPRLVPEVTRAHLEAHAVDAGHLSLLERMRVRSVMAVPLAARGRTFGLVTFVSTAESDRRFTPEDLALAEELARRASLAVENARLYHQAQQAVRLRDEFLSVASHELRTPLTPLSLKLGTLARTLRHQPPEDPFTLQVKSAVEMGLKQVQKLAVLIGDLLDVSRITSGRLALNPEPVDLGALVRDVLARFQPQAAATGCALEAVLDEPLVGTWDRMRLEQVVVNLVDNAMKYGAGRPVHLRLERGGGAADGPYARLTVLDHGIGIPFEHQRRIFERFERAVSERHYGGLGLGLYITRTLVEAMGGSIRVESAPGEGACFTVELPPEAPAGPVAPPPRP
jgi:PAS domain S-box-containing protein